MDPASVYTIIQGAGGLALKCVSLAKTLNDVASKYKQAKLTVMSMVQHVEIVQIAWERIDKWSQEYLRDGNGARCEEDEKLFKRLQTSLSVGTMVMEALEEDLLPFRSQLDNLSLRWKTKIVWSESAFNAHEDRLGHQVQAMTCLLQTINLEVPKTRRDFLEVSEPTLLKSDESAYSIVPSSRSSKVSLATTSTGSVSLHYRPLAFEDALFTAKVYKRNYRNGLINQLFKARTDQGRRVATSEDHSDVTRDLAMALDSFRPLEHSGSHPSTSIDIAFMNACQENATDTLKKLISSAKQADSQKISFDVFRWCLADAIVSNRLEVAENLLLFEDYIIHLTCNDCRFLIERARVKGNSRFFRFLFQVIVTRVDPAAQSYLDDLLFKAARTDSCKMMTMLIEAGASVNCTEQGVGLLHLVSIRRESREHIKILLKHGAHIDAQDNEGKTPLICACSRQKTGNAHYLIASGANFNLTDSTGKQAVDKLQARKVSYASDEGISASDLELSLRVLQNAGIHALDTSLHHHLQTAALYHNMQPTMAAVWFVGGEFFYSLQSFIYRRLESTRAERAYIKEVLTDLIFKAKILRELKSGLVSQGERLLESKPPLDDADLALDRSRHPHLCDKLLCFLVFYIHYWSYSACDNARWDSQQEVHEAFRGPFSIFELKFMTTRELPRALAQWLSNIELALPKDMTFILVPEFDFRPRWGNAEM